MWQEYSFLAGKQAQGERPKVGISACLAGEKVRYNGLDKAQPELLAHLSPHLRLTPLCPEVAIGMGVPRKPIQLVRERDRIDAVPVDESSGNYTEPLQAYAREVAQRYASGESPDQILCGYIFKARSPSCGLGSTPIFYEGNHAGFGDGIFAHQLRRLLPWLPVCEEEDLQSSACCDYFIFRALLVKDFHRASADTAGLEGFHRHHALLQRGARSEEVAGLESLAGATGARTPQTAIAYLTLLGTILDRMGPRELGMLLLAGDR